MDVNSLIKAFSTLDLGSPHTTDVDVTGSLRDAQVKVTGSLRDAQVKTSLIVHLPISSKNTVAATPSLNNTSLPPQASLLGIPQELRDQIYGYLTEDEERIILGWRFVENYKRHYPALSYEDCFTSAIALHPLSMTCKQMLHEFQPELLRATKTRWTLVVNNFDLEQLQFFSDFVNTGISVKPTDRWFALVAANKPKHFRLCLELEYNVQLRLRFQMDNKATPSVAKLCDLFLSTNLDDHDTTRAFRWCKLADVEVAPRYRSRTGVSAKFIHSMTKQEADRVGISLKDCCQEFIESMGNRRRHYVDELLESVPHWIVLFLVAVDDMKLARKKREDISKEISKMSDRYVRVDHQMTNTRRPRDRCVHQQIIRL
jgi:hypothetical protein